MLQKIEPSVAGLELEVICSRPLWQAFDLLPPVDDLFDLDPIPLETEPPRRFIRLVTGVAFNSYEKRFHGLRALGDVGFRRDSPQMSDPGQQLWKAALGWFSILRNRFAKQINS
jgi:hypothetical protein